MESVQFPCDRLLDRSPRILGAAERQLDPSQISLRHRLFPSRRKLSSVSSKAISHWPSFM